MSSNRLSGLLIVFLLLVALASCGGAGNTTTDVNGIKIPNILPEDTVTGTREEQLMIRTAFDKAIADLKTNSENPQPLLDLASAYILEGRISGNGGYYSNAALNVVEQILK